MDFKNLRDKHPQFVYESFETTLEQGNLKVIFHFLLAPDIEFKPSVIFPNVSQQRLDEIGPKVLENLVFNLGMVELLSYWKAACPTEILIKAGFLNEEQRKWWKNLLIKGLGEFFYTNQIDFTKDDLVEFKVEGSDNHAVFEGELENRDLILVGGGKDSAVTLEILGKNGGKSLMLNPTPAAMEIVKISGSKDPIIIQRTIDPKLLELNKAGYLNGHTPFSAYLAFLATIAAVLYNYKNIVVSNEASSNEGNAVWMGQEINHQYSKSFEFENLFREYSKKYLANVNYFSFLRPLTELQISKVFAGMNQYHQAFRSCNRGMKENIWCGQCPKCVSTYLTLYPFLGSKTAEIFGKNLLEDESLVPIVQGLMRENDEVKPFECVATVEEIKVAIFLGLEKAGAEVPKVLQAVSNQSLNKREILKNWNEQNNLTEEYDAILHSVILSEQSESKDL